MSEDYQGTFTISGELFVKNNSSISANVSIGKHLVVEEGIFVKDFIQLGGTSKRMIKSTSNGFGVNVEDPDAILDICGNNSRIINVNSTSAVVNSTLLRNVHDDTFSIDMSNTHTSMDFFVGGNTFSIAYNTLDDFVSINKDVSLSGFLYASDNITSLGNLVIEKDSTLNGNTLIGENLKVEDGVDVVNDISMGGDLTIGGTISLTGSLQLEGDISTNGNVMLSGELNTGEGASFGGDVQINGNMVVHDISSQSLYSEGNVKINNGGLYMNNLLTTDAIIRKYNNNDQTSSSFTIPEDAIYLNHNVVIRGNVYIDGSTNLVGNITAQSGTSGGSSVIRGFLEDLSGTDRTQMYVNFNQDISDTDLKNAGFYIYNRHKDGNRDGFIKISDVSLNRMSFRSIGSERNVIAMDFDSLKNEGKSGLMVLKHDIYAPNNNKDNYRMISSHVNPGSIDVSNSLDNIFDLSAINVIYCEGNIISDNTIHAIDISAQNAYLENIELSKDLRIGGNIYLSDETHTTGNIVSLSLLEDITIGGNINFSDETHTTGNIVSLSLLEDITIGGNIHLSDETHTTGNIYNLSINENLDISNWLSVSNESMYFHRGQLWLPFGDNNGDIQSVTQKINGITSSFQDSNIRPKQNNIFGNNLDLTSTYVNTFETWVSVHQGLHIGDTSLRDTGKDIYTNIPYNLTCIGDVSTNGNVFTDFLHLRDSLFVTNDISTNGDIYGSNMNIFEDLSINGNIYVHNNVFVTNDLSINANLYVTSSTFLNDLSVNDVFIGNLLTIDGNISCSDDISTKTQTISEILIIGGDDTIDNDVLYVNGDISHNGNLVSNNIFVKEILEVAVDTSINDLYIYGDIKTSTQFDDILNVGNDSTIGQTIMNVNGNINLEGTLFSNNALIDGTLTCTDNASIGKNLTVNGDIDLNDGSIQVQYDQSSCTISPFILYNLRDVSQNIQKVLDDIAIEADVRQSANNVFTGDNTFEGALSANTFNILQEVNVIGTAIEVAEYPANSVGYKQKHIQGIINATHNLICNGEKVIEYRFSEENSFVKPDGPILDGPQFFEKYSLEQIRQESGVEIIETVEGGKIECRDLSLGNQLNMYGESKLNMYGEAIIHGTLSIPTFGSININGTIFTSSHLADALSAAAGTTITKYAGETAFGNVVNFNNEAIFKENLRIYKDIELNNNLITITQSTLENLATIDENVQNRLESLKTQTNFISTTANETNVANTLNIGRDLNVDNTLNIGGDLNVTNEVSFNNVLTTHDSVVMNQTDASSYGLTNTIQSNTVSSDITHLDDTIYMDVSYNVYKQWTKELLATSTLPTNDISINQVAHFNYNNNKATIFIATNNNYEIYHDFSDVPIKNISNNDYSFNDIHLLSIDFSNITTVFVHDDKLYTLSIDNLANTPTRNVTNLEISCNHITSHIDSNELAFSTGSQIYTSYHDIIETDSTPFSFTRHNNNSDHFIVGSDTNNNAFYLTYDNTGVFYKDMTQIIDEVGIQYIDVPKNKDLLLLSKANEFKVYKFFYDVSSISLYIANTNEFVNPLLPVFFENFVVTLADNLKTINYYKPQYTQYDATTNYDTTYAIGENIHMTIQDVNGPLPHKDNVVGTLTLKHSQKGGASSIVFPNMSQPGDFATLEYHDSDRNMDSMHLQYDHLSGKQNSVLHIGTKQTSTYTKDNIVMRTGGSLILDAGKYVTEDMSGLFQSSVLPSAFTRVENGEVIIQPNGGNVGIGTTSPIAKLDVSGHLHVQGQIYQNGHDFIMAKKNVDPTSLTANNWGRALVSTANSDGTGDRILSINHGTDWQEGVKSFGNFEVSGNLTVTGTISGTSNSNAATATKLQTVRNIGGVNFDGTSDINLNGVNQAGNQNTSGNAGSATKLQTVRTIGGVNFDGTSNINLNGVNQAGNQNTSGNAGSVTNGVYTTENQSIAGTKTFTAGVIAPSFNATSDYRVKENVQTISGENYTVDNLRPVSYELKDTKKPHIGFIAHELQEHFPTAVNGEKDGENMQTVNYLELIPVLVKEIQDLKKEVKSLKSEISILKS